MKTYKLQKQLHLELKSNFAIELDNGIPTGAFVNMENNQAYLKWIKEGNTPLPADEQGETNV